MSTSTDEQAIQWLDAQLHLLDRQVLDVYGVPVAVVDDLELSEVSVGEIPVNTPAPIISALLTGPVLGTRIFGGRPPQSRTHRIPWMAVVDVGVVIRLAIDGDATDLTWTERWVRERIIGRIPGGRHAAGKGDGEHPEKTGRGGS